MCKWWEGHSEKHNYDSAILRHSLDENFPQVGNAFRRTFGAILLITSMSSDSRSPTIPASISTRTQCNVMYLSSSQKGSDVSTYQTVFCLSQKNSHLLTAISKKREPKPLKVKKMSFRIPKWLTQGHRGSKLKSLDT